MKLNVSVAQSKQSAIPELAKKETSLYYLIIGEGETKLVINVGSKTYDKVGDLLIAAADLEFKKETQP